jgi:hypothetical protein
MRRGSRRSFDWQVRRCRFWLGLFILLSLVRTTHQQHELECSEDPILDDRPSQLHLDASTCDARSSAASTAVPFENENGLVILTRIHFDLDLLNTYLGDNFLLFVTVYDPDCPACQDMLRRVEEAAQIFTDATNMTTTTATWAKIHVDDLREDWHDALDSVPALLFLTAATVDSPTSEAAEHVTLGQDATPASLLVLLEYTGISARARDIADTVLHYSWRLQTLSQHVRYNPQTDLVLPDLYTLDHLHQVYDFVSSQRNLILRLLHVGSIYQDALVQSGAMSSGVWKATELEYYKWLLTSDNVERDDLKVFVQCVVGTDEGMMRAYEQVARVLSNRRDCIYLLAKDCSGSVSVYLYSIPLQDLEGDQGWQLPVPTTFSAS